MSRMEYLKDMPIAVLGGGAVGKTCAADIKLAGREVRLYDMMPFAKKSLKDVDKTGILLDGVQRNRYCFERSGRAHFDLVTTDILCDEIEKERVYLETKKLKSYFPSDYSMEQCKEELWKILDKWFERQK